MDSSDRDRRTPQSYAAESEHGSIVKILLELGNVNSDSSDKAGRTPLSYAAGSGHQGIVKILLEREDADPNSSDRSGRTPPDYAGLRGRTGVLRLLSNSSLFSHQTSQTSSLISGVSGHAPGA